MGARNNVEDFKSEHLDGAAAGAARRAQRGKEFVEEHVPGFSRALVSGSKTHVLLFVLVLMSLFMLVTPRTVLPRAPRATPTCTLRRSQLYRLRMPIHDPRPEPGPLRHHAGARNEPCPCPSAVCEPGRHVRHGDPPVPGPRHCATARAVYAGLRPSPVSTHRTPAGRQQVRVLVPIAEGLRTVRAEPPGSLNAPGLCGH